MKRIVGALLFLILGCVSARAESPGEIPNPRQTRHSWIADQARVLDAPTVRCLDALIDKLERKTGAEIAVVTVHNLGGLSVDEFANRLFNRWGVGKKNQNNGVLLLAAMDDRKFRIEVGDGLEAKISDARAGSIVRDVVVPKFKAGDFDGGLYDGTLAIARRIAPGFDANKSAAKVAPAKSQKPPKKPAAKSAQIPAAPARSFSAPPAAMPVQNLPQPAASPLLWLALLGGGGLFAAVWAGSRPPKCPHCQSALQLLPESNEDAYLSEVQQLEENMGGREWNVWRCPRDGFISIVPHDKMFSSVGPCQRCGHRTATSSTQILERATELHTGLEETRHLCHNPQCGHTWTNQRTIPRDQPIATSTHNSSSSGFSSHSDSSSSSSHSSGGDSFGGGHSSGGGASGSW